MVRRISLLVLFSLSLVFTCLAETWTLREGQTLEAELLSYRRGTVILQKPGGGKLLYQIDRFVEADQERIRMAFPEEAVPEKKADPKPENKAPATPHVNPEKPLAIPEKESKPPLPHLLNTSIGERPPPFQFYPQGEPDPLELEDYRGNLVLVHFWSPRSSVSMESLPYLVKLQEAYGSLGLKFVSIAIEPNRAVMNNVEQQVGLTWPAAIDRSQKISNAWGIQMLPTFALIDQNGFIVSDNARVSEIEGVIRGYLGLK